MINYSDLVKNTIKSIEIKAGRKLPEPKPMTKGEAIIWYNSRRNNVNNQIGE